VRNAFLTIFLFPSFLWSCKKQNTAVMPCNSQPENISLQIKELVYDSLMSADTSYTFIPIAFFAIPNFIQGQWKIAGQTYSNISLSPKPFQDTGNYDIIFNGLYKNPCTGLTSNKQLKKQIEIIEKEDPASRIVSPFIGEYLGHIETNPKDTFRVKISFFNKQTSPTWSYWLTHSSKPFYWISNFPKSFKNVTNDGINYSELSKGYEPYLSYKNFCVKDGYVITNDNSAHNIKGYSAISNRDSLIIDFQIIDTALYNSSKIIKYLKQKFIGKRK
jgi:hypothetical protein